MPLDFTGYVPGIPNMGPKYVPPTTIQLIEALQIEIKAIKRVLETLAPESEVAALTETVNTIDGQITTLQGSVEAIGLILPNKENTVNKTDTINADSTAAQYPNAQAVYQALEGKADSNTTGAAKRSASIPFGECDSTSTATAFTATVPGITELKDGVCMLLYNGVVTSASGFTIDINGLGAKPSYNNMTMGNDVTPTAPTRDTTIFNINYAFLFVYSETLVSGGCWIGYRGYDANTNTIGYQVRTNGTRLKMTDKMYRYRLMFTGMAEDTLVPANNSTSTNATTARTPITRPFNPHGAIYYYGYTTAIDVGGRPAASYYWQQYQSITMGYSFTGSALTEYKSIYIKATPQADGSAVLDPSTPYTQTLPTTNDGSIYIFLGVATSTTAFELLLNHPIYYHDGTALRIWTGPVTP